MDHSSSSSIRSPSNSCMNHVADRAEGENPRQRRRRDRRRQSQSPSAATSCEPFMFGPELPFSQAIASPLSRIPLSSPIGPPVTVSLASPVTASPSMPATPLFATQTRPLTLRRAVRRISFGSLRATSPVLSGKSGILPLGSAFQLVLFHF
ncbi:hypothetical protein DFJ58DRAFT_131191 [Suillus subalutaceus]|uniref:uncharacterized protein n=1 Tax=Suillus subalutaceus TaxID=48586 RepID=UPI001B86D2A2|nr:uncharacterized protein DFJ58DRAFT_131191 [Suillus subalutaceus]KAG1867310.1 hypothetical protein DFJ58DRAFT_131191 [Suillus subalutaceus]